MKKSILLGYILLICTFISQRELYAQSPSVIPLEALAIDDSLEIAVMSLYLPLQLDTVKRISYNDKLFKLALSTKKSLTETSHQLIDSTGRTYRLYVTPFPLFQFNIDEVIVNEPKRMASISYIDKDTRIQSYAGIELRGSSSLAYPKKNYDINLYESQEGITNKHIVMDGMREDDDWILDAIYNEPLRLRSYLSFAIWNDIHKPYYLDKEPNAKSGITAHYSEVFINGRYKGVYLLTEQVDRKLLKLKKEHKDNIRGELFQGARYLGASSFDSLPQKKNYLLSWGGYDIKYPVPNDTPWDALYDTTDFVLNSDDTAFAKAISERFNLDNVIDYFLFINALRGPDNMGKNIFLARYDIGSPYFYIPWDLDGTFGIIYNGKRVSTTDDFLSNGLLRRLLKVNPDNFIDRLQKRWKELRKNVLNIASLQERQTSVYKLLIKNKVYDRERIRWDSIDYQEDELYYMQDWTKKRLLFLDQYISEMDIKN